MDSAGSACLIPPAEVQCRQSEVRKTLPVPVGERHRQGLGSVSDHRTSHTPPRTTRKQCGQRAVKMKQNGEEIAKTAQNARKSFRGRFTRRRSLVRVQQSPPNIPNANAFGIFFYPLLCLGLRAFLLQSAPIKEPRPRRCRRAGRCFYNREKYYSFMHTSQARQMTVRRLPTPLASPTRWTWREASAMGLGL